MQQRAKKFLITTLKVIGWVVVSIVTLLMIVIAVVQIPAVQHKITQKAISFLQEKIGTPVALESLYISFPKNIVLKGFYLEDQAKDTLLYAGKLSVDTDLWALTRNEIQLNNIDLENTTAYVNRSAGDSAFNYTYIMEAFAGDSTAVPDTLEQKGWDFSLKKITLEKINAHYHDQLAGNIVDVKLGEFELKMDEFDLEHYVFGIESVTLADTRADFIQTKLIEAAADESSSDSSAMLDLSFGELSLKNIIANYTQQETGQVIRLDLGETNLEADRIDLKNQVIALDEFSLHRTFIAYQQLSGRQATNGQAGSSAVSPMQASAAGKPAVAEKQRGWKLSLANLDLSDNSIQFYDFRKPHNRGSVDFDHLWITDLGVKAQDLALDGQDIRMKLENFSFREKSGFALRSLAADLKVTSDSASLKNLVLLTDNSKLQLEANAGFESFEQLAETYPRATLRSEIKPSFIGLQDILYFNPALLDSLPLELHPQARINIDAVMNGAINNLSIHHLVVKAFSDTYLKLKGNIVGLPDAEKMSMNLELDKFFTTRSDVLSILPDTLLPDSIAPPEWLNVNGVFKGNAKKAAFNSLLTTAIGSVDLKGDMNLDSASATRGFEAAVSVNEFDVGALLMQPQTIGKLNLQASINSQGLTKEEMSSAMEATVKSFEYQGYRYENFKLKGKVHNDVLEAHAALKDKNLAFALDGDYNFQEDVPKYNFTFDLKDADFKALGLAERPLKARGTLDVNMATADFKILNGSLDIRKVAIFNGDALYAVDSLLFASIDQEGRSEIKIDSDILQGSFAGSINIFELPAVLREYFNTYYSLHDSVEQSYEAPQHFNFALKLRKTDLITDILLPELTSFDPGEIKGEFDSKDKRLELKFDITRLQYGNIGVSSFLFSTNSDSSMLNYNVFVDKVHIDSLQIDGLEFNGTVAHDSIRTNVIVLDSLEQHKYVIGGTFFSHDKEFELQLAPREMVLNYEPWNIPRNNYIRFGGEKLVASNVTLSKGKEKIILESKPDPGTPLFVGFRELSLKNLMSMAAQDEPVSGILHGDVNLFPEKDNFRFTSDIRISALRIADIPWGDLSLAVAQKVTNRFDVDFSLTGDNNDVKVNGYYTAGETASMDLTAAITRFNLAAIQPLTAGQVQNLKGMLTGEMHVKGSPEKPDIDGSIRIQDTQFLSTYLNSPFNIKDESITFNNRGISFDKFQLVDARNNTATLDGMILTRDYRDFRFRLDLTTRNFRLLNTTAKDNELFYGRIDMDANARIRGTTVNPSVDMEVSLNEGDHLTYIVPQSEAAVLEQQGIVKFVDKTFKADPFMKEVQHELADTIKSTFTGIDLTAKVELSDKETFTVIIDPTTNDQLTVKGNTTLTLQMDRSGDMQLSGRYEISEGTYNLSFYKFVKREFQIEKGSTMTWSGDPLNAAMDIHAIFKVETSPIDLLANQLQGTDPKESNQYKRRLPFLVYLNIGGQLLKPDITFRLDMPMEERNALGGNVYSRLLDINTRESDLNKQVFALLILKRFIADNPFESQSGGSLAGTARSSVSKILTEQLNRLSENVKGVELSFDVKSYEDYSTGQAEGQTELQLGLSKTLLNDRLVVKVSGNIDVEGQNTNRDATDYIGDLALEYMLTDDGRFRITGFRNSNYDMIDGELIETGAGLIYIKDYNTLSELFKANAKTKN